MKIKLYTCDPVHNEPGQSFWRYRGVRKTWRGAVMLRRKLIALGYDKDVSITYEVV